jgi:hypothetical protein
MVEGMVWEQKNISGARLAAIQRDLSRSGTRTGWKAETLKR